MQKPKIMQWLKEKDPDRLAELWRRADEVRRLQVGDDVHLRGLIEISSHCVRRCHYCGLRRENRKIHRYRLRREEILACVRQAAEFGYGTVVLQSGEDREITGDWMTNLIGQLKSETDLAITLSLGERTCDELTAWRRAGADRYLLRFESSNKTLYRKIHPSLPGQQCDRMELLQVLGELGYEVGSGIMIGLPGQRYEDLAEDIVTFSKLDVDMIGVGPYLPHPDTPLGKAAAGKNHNDPEQVPNNERMTYKTLALTRLLCPEVNLPSTTALATINRTAGREQGLCRGANVVMPNLTPTEYRALYEIYPAKACCFEPAKEFHAHLMRQIGALGRTVGKGPGASIRYLKRTENKIDNQRKVPQL